MLLIPTLLLVAQMADLRTLDAMAQKRDVAGITRFLTPDSLKPINPLQVLQTNGAYDTGRFGWHAFELDPPGGGKPFVVFGTPLTSEDVGELLFERQGAALKYIAEDFSGNVRILRHKFDVSFDNPSKRVMITDEMQLKKNPEAAHFFIFRMSPYLKVESITSAGKDVPFEQASGVTAVITFANPTATYTVKYSGVCSLPGYAGSITDDELQLANDYWYPMIARLPAPYDITIHTPKGWTAVGQGDLVSMTEDDKTRTTKYRMDLPVTYYSLSAGPYKEVSQLDGKKRISAWSMSRTPEQLQQQIELYKPILSYYEANFGPSPFSGFGALHSNLYGGGALEAYSYATYGFGVPSEDAHEPAHTWWGGMLNNTYLHSMWNESFANYCEGLYERNVPIGHKQERQQAFVSDARPDQAYLTATCEGASPWYGGDAVSIGYGKGAKVLQMLEVELGTETMIKAMQQWLKDQPKGETAEWSGFEKTVNKVTKKDYKWFFDQWLRRTGWAKFEVKNVKWVQGLLNGEIWFTSQPYKINCELLLEYPDGKKEFTKFDTTQSKVQDHYVFTIRVPNRPSIVSVDPWRRVLRETKNDESPVNLATAMRGARRFTAPSQREWLKGMGGASMNQLPRDLTNTFIVGTSESIPEMALLCGKAGFVVRGDKLTYDKTTIDLRNGGALAVVDLENGKRCVIGLGNFKMQPNTGRARTIVFDQYGRFLRGKTEPKTTGWMTFKLGPTGKKTPVTGGGIK